MKCSEGLSNRVSNIIGRYIDRMKFAVYVAFSFIAFFHVLLVPFFLLYIWLYVLYAFVQFRKLCSFIVTFMFSYLQNIIWKLPQKRRRYLVSLGQIT